MDQNKFKRYMDDIFLIVLFSPIWITLGVGIYVWLMILYTNIFG